MKLEKGHLKSLGLLLAATTTIMLGLVSASASDQPHSMRWILVDDFESQDTLSDWVIVDADNQTDPHIPNPQIAEIHRDGLSGNSYFLRKPAANGIVGNRKAISFTPLPFQLEVGQIYTLYTRISVESFPNNHSFGLTNLTAADIADAHYDSFEPMIRVTDKAESNGEKNDGTLMVLGPEKTYRKISHLASDAPAMPLVPGEWYEVWVVINNNPVAQGGQTYDLYVRGGEFEKVEQVAANAHFRIGREAPLLNFMTICNTGPKRQPYGNGGLKYDDIYVALGTNLTTPVNR